MFQPRIYRERINNERFKGKKIIIEESDLWVGINTESYSNVDFEHIHQHLFEIRGNLKSYILDHPEFRSSLHPLEPLDTDPDFIIRLKEAGLKAGVGPMAGIAGFVAEEIARTIKMNYDVKEVVIENGGDICLWIERDLNLALDSGTNKNFENLGLEIKAENDFLGICSSSGTFGHSFSMGSSDLLMVIANDTVLADSWATSLANYIRSEEDIDKIISKIPKNLKAFIAVKDNKIAYKGNYKVININ